MIKIWKKKNKVMEKPSDNHEQVLIEEKSENTEVQPEKN